MSPTKDKDAAKTKRKQRGRVELLNERFVKFKAQAEEIAKLLTAAGPQTELLNLREKIGETASLVASIAEACTGVSENLLALHKAKWELKAESKALVEGSLAKVKSRHVDLYAGLYDKADLAALRVVSIHGKLAKVEIFRDGLKGEMVGVIPAYRLQARDK